MKKRNFLTGTLLTLCAASLTLGFTSCDLINPPSESSSTPETGWGTVFTLETAYAQAQALGYTGSLEDFIESISGKDGVGIANIGFNANGELVITLTNSTNVNLGKIQGAQGPQGEKGEPGKDGIDGADGKDGEQGEQGVGIEKVENVDGYLVITLTDGTKLDPIEIPAGGSASVAQESLFYQKIKGEEAYRVIGLGNVSDLDIVIPATYRGLPVTEIGDRAFASNASYISSDITSITIPDSVTKIGCEAFVSCSNLTSITIPNSVTSIGDYAFYNCSNLTAVYITDIAKWCALDFGGSSANPLYYAHNLYLNGELVTDLVIPDSVTSIGSGAFYGCSSLTSITIPDSVTSIGYQAFSSCSSLTNITIPDSVTSIGDDAFYKCSSLTSINIPDGVTSIGSRAFSYCSSLTSINIPDGVTSIGDDAFYKCSSLTNITIPDSVTSIGYDAFRDCSSLTNITIPDSVTSIGSYAFYDCNSLTSVYYDGTREQWSNMNIGSDNYYLTITTRYYYSETEPADEGNYWHYVDGVPTIW